MWARQGLQSTVPPPPHPIPRYTLIPYSALSSGLVFLGPSLSFVLSAHPDARPVSLSPSKPVSGVLLLGLLRFTSAPPALPSGLPGPSGRSPGLGNFTCCP